MKILAMQVMKLPVPPTLPPPLSPTLPALPPPLPPALPALPPPLLPALLALPTQDPMIVMSMALVYLLSLQLMFVYFLHITHLKLQMKSKWIYHQNDVICFRSDDEKTLYNK